MNDCNCPLCLCFIIPNDITREIAKNGDADDQDLALKNLSRNSKIRERRSLLTDPQFAQFAAATRIRKAARVVYSAQNTQNLPGVLARTEGGRKTTDDEVNDSYTASGIVRDFLTKVLNYNSYDGKGANLISTVHFDEKYNNAFWNGEQMVYGDGDGKYFNPFTSDLEITGHEIFHGVIGESAGLIYEYESGALNESFCDVFGSMIKQWRLKQSVDKADWIIGKGLFTDKVKGVGVRKLDAPGTAFNDPVLGKDNTRGNYKNRYRGSGNNGGVHFNSGIPSLAFVTACKRLGGNSWDIMGKIWWTTLTQELKPRSNFKDAAKATLKVARQMYPSNKNVASAIQSGWEKVGVI